MNSEPAQRPAIPEMASTGCPGLDDILAGGLDLERVYLIEGRPWTGKTTLALQFLLAGVRQGEPCLYVTLSESERVKVGPPLTEFQGVLSGVPTYRGKSSPLLPNDRRPG